jgi:hypothetical protein
MNDHYVEERSLSMAWAEALRRASAPSKREIAPLTVSITGFDAAGEVEDRKSVV